MAQALRPFPQYQGVNIVAAPYDNSTYNSLQIKVDKRFSHGLSGTFAYTHSKMLSDGVGFTTSNYTGSGYRQNYYKREKFLYPTDQPNLFAFSANYALPYGRGSQSGAMRKILGGWSLAAFGTYGSGFLCPMWTVNTNSIAFTGGLRPNLTGQPIRATIRLRRIRSEPGLLLESHGICAARAAHFRQCACLSRRAAADSSSMNRSASSSRPASSSG